MGKPAIQHLLELLSRLSLGSLYRIGDLMGFVLGNTSNQVSRQARQNIELCFADRERAERRQLYRECMRHTCYAVTELAAVWCWPVERVLASITSADICAEFESSQKSRIILAPHLGSWETLAVWLGRHCDIIMMYKRRKHRGIDRFVLEARARSGGSLVSTKKRGLRQLLVGLKKGKDLMILPDQKPGGRKAFIEATFFGFNAPTTTLVHNICSKIDCDVFIADMCRSQPPGEFRLKIRPLEHARLAADGSGSAQYMNDAIEALVREHLEQYQWGYQRFHKSVYAATGR